MLPVLAVINNIREANARNNRQQQQQEQPRPRPRPRPRTIPRRVFITSQNLGSNLIFSNTIKVEFILK